MSKMAEMRSLCIRGISFASRPKRCTVRPTPFTTEDLEVILFLEGSGAVVHNVEGPDSA